MLNFKKKKKKKKKKIFLLYSKLTYKVIKS